MYKRLAALLMSFSIVFSLPFTASATEAATEKKESEVTAESSKSENLPFTVKARSAVLMEPSTGKIIYQYNGDAPYPPASVTKVMTMLLIFEAVDQGKIKWDDIVTVSEHAASMGGSQVFLEPGEQQTVRDLLKCIAVSSANDGSVAMGEFIAGSEEGFIDMMNKKAKSLGMKNTNFVNACGLDAAGHETSAVDIALMSRELVYKYPEIHDFTTIWMDTIIHKTARGETEFGLSNTNKLLKTYTGATGLKTGSTSEAKFCISATAERDGMSLIAVIMGSDDSATRFDEARKLLDYGFANYTLGKGEAAGTDKGQIKVTKGDVESVKVTVKDQVNVVMDKGNHVQLESRIEILDSVNAPVEAGTKVGEVIYLSEGKEVGRSDLITAENVNKAHIGHMTKRLIQKWFE